jgi:hypothetical protein
MAAEWVAKMRAANKLPGNATRTSAFKQALRNSARPWSRRGWQSKFGVGIADMTKLMESTRM